PPLLPALNDTNPGHNSDTETTGVITRADVAVNKTVVSPVPPTPVVAGQNITYTIVVSNAGPNPALNVSLSDAIPAGTTFVSATQTAGPTFTLTRPPVGGTGTLTGTLATLTTRSGASFQAVVRVHPHGSTRAC